MVILDQPTRLATNSAYGYDIKLDYGRISMCFMNAARKNIKINRAKPNRVRIIAGDWRSRLLKFPDVSGLRPTTDKGRETLFNWLGQYMYDYSCLDLFSGSGALGFEALSRGAAYVVMVEKQQRVFDFLAENAKVLGAGSRLTLIHQDALDFLHTSKQRFDLVFLDPPFGYGLLDRVLPDVVKLIKPGGLVYVESEEEIPPPKGLRFRRHAKSGVSHHLLFEASVSPFDENNG